MIQGKWLSGKKKGDDKNKFCDKEIWVSDNILHDTHDTHDTH